MSKNSDKWQDKNHGQSPNQSSDKNDKQHNAHPNQSQGKNNQNKDFQKEYKSEFMHKAIDLSKRASIIEKTGGVFGAVIVKDGKVIAEGYNQVIKHNDPTWHAEMQAIREACKKLGTPHLDGCILYTSAECCPMCLAAAYWAHIDHIFYGARIEDSLKYGDFQDVGILDELRKEAKDRRVKFTEMMRPEAVEIWKQFSQMADRARY